MTTRDGIFLPTKKIASWREEDERLEREITERLQRRAELRRKIDAADILAEDTDQAARPAAEKAESEDDAEANSPAAAFVANLRSTGDSLKVQQAKQRLADIGFPEEANRKNYIYGLLYRLTKSGKLVKRGLKYRAAPSSPEGETEAVGASARH